MKRPRQSSGNIDLLLEIMSRLRDPDAGCPWDLQQNYRSIVPYTLEEACEVAEAAESNDLDALRDELGDLLFQVVFLSQLAFEEGSFDFPAVITSICDKLVRRHPHVFGQAQVADAEEQSHLWERHKDAERGERVSLMDDIPLTLTALTRAAKLQKRAARVGFDWPDIGGTFDKTREELQELESAIAGQLGQQEIMEEAGDLLFAVVNLLRHAGLDPEAALRAGNRKFERRFRTLEQQCAARGVDLQGAGLDVLEQYWLEIKQGEPAGNPPGQGCR